MSKEDDKRVLVFICFMFFVSRLFMYFTFHRVTGEWNFTTFLDRFNVFDTAWYHHYVDSILNAQWYVNEENGQAVWAFFPLYPMLVAFVYRLTACTISMKLIGCLISSCAFLVSQYVAYKYICLTRKNTKIAYYYIAFMSLGLYSFYFSIMYTESLFILLLTLSFYYLKKEEYIKMGIAGLLLSATRNTGVMFVFVVLVYCTKQYIIKQDKNKTIVFRVKDFISTHLQNEKLVLGTCMIPLGLFSYMLVLYKTLGDGLAFVHVQRAWGRVNLGTWHAVKEAVVSIFPPDYLGVMFIGFLCLIIISMINNKTYDELIYALIVMVLATSSNLQSIPRYMIGCFVVVLAFADEFHKRSVITKIMVAVLVIGFELILMREWLNYNLLIC